MGNKEDPVRCACMTSLHAVLEKGAYANIELDQVLNKISFSVRDRQFFTAMFYGTLTWAYTLDVYWQRKVDNKHQKIDGYVKTALRMGAWQIMFAHAVPTFAAVNETVAVASKFVNPGARGLLNAVLRSLAQDKEEDRLDLSLQPPDVRFALKRELYGCLVKWFGDERAKTLGEALLTIPNTTIRVNTIKTDKKTVKKALTDAGYRPDDGLFIDTAIRITEPMGASDLATILGFGHFTVQDEASMLPALVGAPTPGQAILDMCAAPGGKTCHMAELSEDWAEIVAMDLYPQRVKLIDDNARRLDLKSIQTMQADARDAEKMTGGRLFDLVLLDAPCSGLGVIRKKPDIRQKMSYAVMQDLIVLQAELLRAAANRVRPGGVLVYSTCTINPNENELQIKAFLKKDARYSAKSVIELLPQALLSMDDQIQETARCGYLTLMPDKINCDGFFVARLRRLL